jgi:hypothetical protein
LGKSLSLSEQCLNVNGCFSTVVKYPKAWGTYGQRFISHAYVKFTHSIMKCIYGVKHPTNSPMPWPLSLFLVIDGTPLFFKVSLVGTPSIEWCGKRSFPYKWYLFFTLLATCNSKPTALRPQLTVVVVRHQQLASLQNQK